MFAVVQLYSVNNPAAIILPSFSIAISEIAVLAHQVNHSQIINPASCVPSELRRIILFAVVPL
jgi:hypothetical protein